MPNQVTSHNDRTLFKAVRTLVDGGLMPFDEAMKVVDCLIDGGLLIREPAERETGVDKESPKKLAES